MTVRLDMADLTLGELADVSDLLDAPLHEAMQGKDQPRAMAAIACVIQRRTDPTYTLEQALGLHMSDLEVVNPPEADSPKGNSGTVPVLSRVSGD